jgi:hypothetical protein
MQLPLDHTPRQSRITRPPLRKIPHYVVARCLAMIFTTPIDTTQ